MGDGNLWPVEWLIESGKCCGYEIKRQQNAVDNVNGKSNLGAANICDL